MINMQKEGTKKDICSFSQSKLQRLIANHIDKFIWGCIFFIMVFAILRVFRVGFLSTYAIIILILLLILPYVFTKLQRKFAYKIIINFDSQVLQLFMHRSGEAITADFNEIENIRVNGYIIFVLKNKKVFYNDLQNIELFNCLNRIKQIYWGALCSVFGPNKSVREKVGGHILNIKY
jgi:hypothetical protein